MAGREPASAYAARAVSKNGEPRDIPINDTLAKALKQLPSRFGQGYLFPSPKTGGRLTDVKKQFRSTVKRAGLLDVRFHDTRHTFASHLVMNGVSLETVADLLGHSTVRMTERSAHLSPHHRSRAIAVLDSAYRSDTESDTVEISPAGQSS